MATHSSILAWKIPWTEEPGNLQTMGRKGVDRTEHGFPPANTRDIRDVSSIPGLGRSLRGGHGNPLQYSCLKNQEEPLEEAMATHSSILA